MYRIIGDSFVNPAGIIEQRKRSGWFVALYIFIIGLLLSLPTTVGIIKFNGINYGTKMEITNNILSFNLKTEIVDGVLNGDKEAGPVTLNYYGYNIYLLREASEANILKNGEIAVVVCDEYIYFVANGMQVLQVKIVEASEHFRNVDFSDRSSILENFCSGLDDIVLRYKWSFGIFIILISIVSSILTYLLYIGISYLFMGGFRKVVKKSHLFKIITFALTPVMLAMIFANILNISGILYFGLIIGGFYFSSRTFKTMARIIMENNQRQMAEAMIKRMQEEMAKKASEEDKKDVE